MPLALLRSQFFQRCWVSLLSHRCLLLQLGEQRGEMFTQQPQGNCERLLLVVAPSLGWDLASTLDWEGQNTGGKPG